MDKDVDMLRPGDLLRGRWDVKNKLGGGGFGQIYIAYDSKAECDVAIKTELRPPKGDDKPDSDQVEVLSLEHKVLVALAGQPHFCKVYGCGSDPTYNFLVMTLCGANLTELRKETPQQYFSFGTAVQLAIQCVEAVQSLHNVGYLHRDIKPSNFAIGRGPDTRMVYMVDFGMAREYIKWEKKADGTMQARMRRERTAVGFRGTVRYAPIAIHEKREMGRVDDLWSVFYMLIEMAVGQLPWRGENDRKVVYEIKKRIYPDELLHGMPPPLLELVKHMEELGYADPPNYSFIIDRLRNSLRALALKQNEPFDWENKYVNCTERCPFHSPSL